MSVPKENIKPLFKKNPAQSPEISPRSAPKPNPLLMSSQAHNLNTKPEGPKDPLKSRIINVQAKK